MCCINEFAYAIFAGEKRNENANKCKTTKKCDNIKKKTNNKSNNQSPMRPNMGKLIGHCNWSCCILPYL